MLPTWLRRFFDSRGPRAGGQGAAARVVLKGPTDTVRALAFSPDGQLLASAGSGAAIILWDLATRRQRTSFPAHDGWVLTLGFSLDGGTLTSHGNDGIVRLWEVGTGKELATFEKRGPSWVTSLDPGGRYLACGNYD